MADDSPTHRISQIFNSLSGLTELQRQQNQLPNRSIQHNSESPGTETGIYESSNVSTTSTASSSSSSATAAGHSSSSLPFVSVTPNTSLPSTSAPSRSHQSISSRSTPNSPRLVPKRHRAPPAVPQRPNAAHIANPALLSLENMTTGSGAGDGTIPATAHGGSWSHFSSLTEHLDVRQVNNYAQAMPEINWQERALELQLELHRSKNQSGRIRDMLREKVRY